MKENYASYYNVEIVAWNVEIQATDVGGFWDGI